MGDQTPRKTDLRAVVLRRRRERSREDLAVARAAVCRRVLERSASWGSVAAYEPLATEPGSFELLDALATPPLVPVLRTDRDLDWTRWRGPDRLLGHEAIAGVDAVVVPALAVDGYGHRLGRGGGSYDRALRRVRPGVPIIALLFADEFGPVLPVDAWDVPVTAVVTPDGWHDLPRVDGE